MDDHGDLIHILAIGQTMPRGKATSIVELTSASVSSASGSACSYGFSMCRRKCRRSELYADREDSRVRGHEAVSTLSKSRKAFQQAERRPLLGAEMWPSRRTASLSSASDGYCWSSCQLCLASARRLIADESVSIGLGTSVLLALCRNSRTLVLKWGGGMGGLARRRSRRRLRDDASALAPRCQLSSPFSHSPPTGSHFHTLNRIRVLGRRDHTMRWPYQFVDLTDAQKLSRRTLLDNYGLVAQSSAGIVLIVIQLFFLAQWMRRQRQQKSSDVPGSPSIKHLQKSGPLNIQTFERRWRRLEWWFGDSLVVSGVDFGTNGQVLAAALWTTWLLILSFAETGNGKYPIVINHMCFQWLTLCQTISTSQNGLESLEPHNYPSTTFSYGNPLGHRYRYSRGLRTKR